MLALGILLIALGIAVLWVSADPFVVAASRLAHQWGISPVLVGALVVGFGTSAPELLVSGLSAARGELAQSIGNVVGSNTVNLSLVLGVAALLAPVAGQVRVIRREGVLTLLAMAAVTYIVWDDTLTSQEGTALIVSMALASVLLIFWSGRDHRAGLDNVEVDGVDATETYRAGRQLLIALLSIIGVVSGAALLVEGGKSVAEVYGLTGGFVGATIFALGTSLPELVTAIAAARRKANNLLIGNLLGSNLFNSLLVVGTTGVIGPGSIGERRISEHLFMLAVGGAVGIFGITRNRFGRFEGVALLGGFGGFIYLVAQNATL